MDENYEMLRRCCQTSFRTCSKEALPEIVTKSRRFLPKGKVATNPKRLAVPSALPLMFRARSVSLNAPETRTLL